MGQTGFCENLWFAAVFCENLGFAAVFCENLRFPAVFCESLRLENTAIPRKSENQQRSATICEFQPFVAFSWSLLVPPEEREQESHYTQPESEFRNKHKV